MLLVPNPALRRLDYYVRFQNLMLADHCRWLLGSKLVYLRKKKGTKPRPIRIGEFWRRVIAKKLVQSNASVSRKIFAQARQFGISILGGTEALIHFRTCLEAALKKDDGLP